MALAGDQCYLRVAEHNVKNECGSLYKFNYKTAKQIEEDKIKTTEKRAQPIRRNMIETNSTIKLRGKLNNKK